MIEILFKNARVVDGSGSLGYVADVAVKDGKIVRIDAHIEESAHIIIDAKEKVLAPGFIDTHTHSDLALLKATDCMYKLQQGVTTEIGGQCGLSIAPVSKHYYEERNMRSMVGALVPNERKKYTSSQLWHSDLEKMKLGTNQMLFVGQGTIRETVMGYADRSATPEELLEMKALVTEAMEAGCLGMSSGLAYSPGSFTPHEEIVALCKVVAAYEGIYVSHMKNQADQMLDCIKDTIDVAKQTGCKACISHIKSIGKRNWGKMDQAIQLIAEARENNLDIWCDTYPYIAGSTTLTVTLPPSLLEGGVEEMIRRIQEPQTQQYIKEQFVNPTENWENAIGLNGFDSFLIAIAPTTPEAVGKTISQYAASLKIDDFEAYIKLLVENKGTVITVNFLMSEQDLITAIKSDICMIGSDGTYLPGNKATHPRAIGTFPRFLGRYARDQKLIALEQAVAKITGYPAKKYALHNKGLIKEGYDADLVLFDWKTIIDTSDYVNCFGDNIGIDYVVVNGKIAVEKGKYNGTKNGVFIRKE